MEHGTAFASDSNVLAHAGDGLDRAGRPEEGDWHLLRVAGLATVRMVHEQQVALRCDDITPGALLGSGRRLGEGERRAGHVGFGCPGRDVPELGRAIRVARDQRGSVQELHFGDRTTAKVSACTSVTALEKYEGVSSPCHFHSAFEGFRTVFLIAIDVSDRSCAYDCL